LATSVYELDPTYDTIKLSYGQTWPGTRYQDNAVYIDYWVGYFDDASPTTSINLRDKVPQDLKVAISMYVSDMLENVGVTSDIQMYENKAFSMLVNPYKVYVK